jgi:hypothetical protein
MDLENELRQAMAEHVTEVSAPRSLAAEARRRHHRTVRRRTTLAVGAAGLVVAGVVMVPAYQSFHPRPVGADGQGGTKHGARTTGTPPPASPVPSPKPHTASPGSGSKGSQHPPASKHPSSGHVPGVGALTSPLGYLPVGIGPGKTCDTDHVGAKETTSCRWSGPGGWVEVRLVRSGALRDPADLGLAPPMAKRSQIHDHPALVSRLPSQVMWIERPGLGVWVGVSPSLNGSLMRVAEGVNVP